MWRMPLQWTLMRRTLAILPLAEEGALAVTLEELADAHWARSHSAEVNRTGWIVSVCG